MISYFLLLLFPYSLATKFVFSTEKTIAWCDFSSELNVSGCNPLNTNFQKGWNNPSLTLYSNSPYVFDYNYRMIYVWTLFPSALITKFLLPSDFVYNVDGIFSQWSDFLNGFILGISSFDFYGKQYFSLYLTTPSDWNMKLLSTFQGTPEQWRGGFQIYNNWVILASCFGTFSNLTNFNASVIAYDMRSGNSRVLFECSGKDPAICFTQGFTLFGSTIYFSTGWELYSISMDDFGLELVLNIESLLTVNGEFGGAWMDSLGNYWYSDYTGNTNCVITSAIPPIAIQMNNQLGSVGNQTSFIYQAIIVP